MIPLLILAIEDEDDRDFMIAVYKTYRRLIFSKVGQIVPDRSVSEDLVQDVLVKLIDKVQLLRTLDTRRLAAYIAEASRNTAIDHLRKTRETVPIDESMLISGSEASAETGFLRNHDISELKRVWPELKPATREVLSRKYFLLQSDEEIAQAFRIRPASVRMLLTRARREAYELLRDSVEP